MCSDGFFRIDAPVRKLTWRMPCLLFILGIASAELAWSDPLRMAPPGQIHPAPLPPARPGPTSPATYFSAHGPESLSIALDRIGILVRDGVSIDSMESYADSVGLQKPISLDPRFFTFQLPRRMARDGLVTFARRLRARGSRFFAEVGMLATIRGGRTPLLVTDQFIVEFRPKVTPKQVSAFNAGHPVTVLEAGVLKQPNHYLLEVKDVAGEDALTMAELYRRSGLVTYAHPNFIHAFRYRGDSPDDRCYARQWHLDNTGQDGGTSNTGASSRSRGTVDADIDWPEAWRLVKQVIDTRPGNAEPVTIAVIDGAFLLTHEDLSPNLWVNVDEVGGAPWEDRDGNGFPGDLHGYDFLPCDGPTGGQRPCGDGDPSVAPGQNDGHGTRVAGLIGAAMGNGTGGVGACPSARLMLIRKGSDQEHIRQAFLYANLNGAKIISCSWGYTEDGSDTQVLNDAINEVVSKGSVVLFAIDDAQSWSMCERRGSWDLSELRSVIAVGGSTNWDLKLPDAACGDYVDILGPARRGSGSMGMGFKGTLGITTTDIKREAPEPCCPWTSPVTWERGSYTCTFGGTSAATAIVAGVAGMILTVKDDLSPVQVRRLLQDTADKIEPSEAGYDDRTGFSHPTSEPASTHAYGRVNAFEAVRVVAPVDAGGNAGVDIFLRDNRLDWGNTEQPSTVTFEQVRGYEPHWESPDIKIDAGPNYQAQDPTISSFAFDGLVDENPIAGGANRIYVRVRNRGPLDATAVTVKLYWAYAGTAAPPLPSGFWASFPERRNPDPDFDPCQEGATLRWTFIGERTLSGRLPYSGSTAARESRDGGGTPSDDGARVFEFADWTGPRASCAPGVLRGVDHLAILAIVDSPDDHVSPLRKPNPTAGDLLVDLLAPSDNNVAIKDVYRVATAGATHADYSFYLRNPTEQPIETYFRILAPSGWVSSPGDSLSGRPELLEGRGTRLVSLAIGAPSGASGEVRVVQYRKPPPLLGRPSSDVPMGGVTIRVGNPGTSSPPQDDWSWAVVIGLALLILAILVIVVVLVFR